MGLFDRQKIADKAIIQKSKTAVSKSSIKAGTNISSQVQAIINLCDDKLSKYKDKYMVIRSENDLIAYINQADINGYCAIDTESTGLNVLTVDIVGICLYTPGQKACYVPINHKSHITGMRTSNQLDIDTVAKVLNSFNGKWIMHNAKYDIRLMRHTLDIDLECYWDTQLAANCIDEEESHRLKDLHLKYCKSEDDESLTFDKLFNGITFDNVPISTAYLYAAGDAIKTYELYQYQKDIFKNPDMAEIYKVFKDIEMPVLKVCCDMEDRGVCLDFDIAEKLHIKYTKLREESMQKVSEILNKYDDIIRKYKLSHKDNKLSNPINISSPTQLAILFYDILQLSPVNKKQPRGTGEEILQEFAKGEHKELCQAILKIRELDKLLSTYIDKMPTIVHTDGRVHCNYNQYGAKTGRFSSSDPNMQNIPSHSHTKEIRLMFKAQDGYILIGSDFSQQEPMVTAHLSNDAKMKQAFIDGKDIYSTIASIAFNKPYDECKEFRPDGTVNKEGKERRTQAKSIVLGVLYGRQIPSIAEQLNVTKNEAQKIYDKVMASFPALAKFIDDSQNMAKSLGYVTTGWGRRRHLKDMQLETYEFTALNGGYNFDPLNFAEQENSIPQSVKKKYIQKLNKSYGYNKQKIIQQAKDEGIIIKDNGGFIAQAERQCVNARVQGTAADITKLALIDINNDEEMKKLDFHILIQVHDEIIGECPKENAKKAGKRLSYLMRTAPTRLIDLPFKCDVEYTNNWYGESVEV